MDIGPFVHDDQRPLELAHVLGVDPEVGLERHLDPHARRHVDERAPDQTAEFRAANLLSFCGMIVPKYCFDELLVLTQARVHVQEDHALLLEVLLELVVDDLGLVLRPDAGEVLLLRLGDAELVPGVLDLARQILPRRRLLLGRADVVEDVLEVDAAQVVVPTSASAARGSSRATCGGTSASRRARSCATRSRRPARARARGRT